MPEREEVGEEEENIEEGKGSVRDDNEAGAKRSLVVGEITFCNSTVRRRILIPAINLHGSPRTDLFDPGWTVLSSAGERL